MDRSLRELASGLRSREFTSLDLLTESLEALDTSEPRLNAYKLRTEDFARRAAERADAAFGAGSDAGMLQGIPVSVKDLYGVPGLPTFAGSARQLPAKWEAAGPLVARLLHESAVIVGKTHTVEFAFGALGVNHHWGTPRNPWDKARHRVPGGSSSGAAVSLCQGSAIIALGSDTAGSVRLPASLTGNVGYKPTIDRWSTAGISPLSRIFDSPGLLTRSVDDVRAAACHLDSYAFGHPPGELASFEPHALRIGVPEHFFWDDCDAGIVEGVRGALRELEKAGHKLVPVDFPQATRAFEVLREGGTSGAELLAFLQHELPEWLRQLDPYIGIRMEGLAHITAVEFLRRKAALEDLASEAIAVFDSVDVIASPTTPISPPLLEELATWDQYRVLNQKMVRNSSIANLLRQCALTMPVALDALGMPVGMQLMAAGGRDATLLGAGMAFEAALGNGRQRLGICPGR
ncbi:MAG: amidase [Usitatibacter sp.]